MANDETVVAIADAAFEMFLSRTDGLFMVKSLLRTAFAAGILHEMENRLEAIEVPCPNPTEETADAAQN